MNIPPYNIGLKPAPATWLRRLLVPAVACTVLLSGRAQAEIRGPYEQDKDTLHLWHMDGGQVPLPDFGLDPITLTAARNGATLSTASYSGFGNALNTFGGGPDVTTEAGRGAYLSAKPLVNGLADNVAMTYAGSDGAFTFEALVRVDFDPTVNYGLRFPDHGLERFMQIVNLDADEPTNRTCQFRIIPIGVQDRNRNPEVEFINLNRDGKEGAIQSLVVDIPTTGADAIAIHSWYHVAVTYNGKPGTTDNLKFYWTRLQPSQTAARLIGTGTMVKNLPKDCSPDLAIGQTGRQSNVNTFPNQNFVGLIDEVRISSIARQPTGMIFTGQPAAIASTAPHPAAAAPAAASPQKAGNDQSMLWVMIGGGVVVVGVVIWVVLNSRKPAAKDKAQAGRQAANGSSLVLPGNKAAASATGRSNTLTQPLPTPAGSAPMTNGSLLGSVTPEVIKPASTTPKEAGVYGNLHKVSLLDVIQLECLNKTSSIIEVIHETSKGQIFIEHGEIIHATIGGAGGEDAFLVLFAMSHGEFSVIPFAAPPSRTINTAWMNLLMEATMLRDKRASTTTTN
jgi:hypothetical protein